MRRQLAAAHAVVVSLRDRKIEPHLVLEVLNELRDIGGCDLHLAIDRVIPFARRDNLDLIRYCRGSRSFREELHKRDSLFAISLLAHSIMIQPLAALQRDRWG